MRSGILHCRLPRAYLRRDALRPVQGGGKCENAAETESGFGYKLDVECGLGEHS